MAYRFAGFAVPRSVSGRVLFVALTALALAPAACSDGDEKLLIGSGDTGDGGARDGSATGFETRSDAGDAQADVKAPNRTMCVATECPWPFETCTDGVIPSYACGTNLLTDNRNCGACGNVCPNAGQFPELNMQTQCVDGVCARQCTTGGSQTFRDCNGLVDDGCETGVTNDPNNCGACGIVCPPDTDGVARCIGGQCNCPQGQTYCPPLGCTDTRVDDQNCGSCGNFCKGGDAGPPPPHMEYKCSGGQCGQLVCEKGWLDCNDELPISGCEVNEFTDNNNCGACGNVCPAGQHCLMRGDVPACGCEPLETLCTDGEGKESCVDLLNDVKNCGACGYTCPRRDSYTVTCNKGYCEYECPPNKGDCDGDVTNGCETDLLINGRHCGACGNQCNVTAGQPCVNGSCLTKECDAGEVPQ